MKVSDDLKWVRVRTSRKGVKARWVLVRKDGQPVELEDFETC